MKKTIIILFVLLSVVGFLFATDATSGASKKLEEFTIQELAENDGKNGMPAYIAYDGYVYDVSDHPKWQSGSHGGQMAGTDITNAIKSAPHGASKIDGLTKVGILVK